MSQLSYTERVLSEANVSLDRSLVNLPVLGIPASLALAYVSPYNDLPVDSDVNKASELSTCSAQLEFTSKIPWEAIVVDLYHSLFTKPRTFSKHLTICLFSYPRRLLEVVSCQGFS